MSKEETIDKMLHKLVFKVLMEDFIPTVADIGKEFGMSKGNVIHYAKQRFGHNYKQAIRELFITNAGVEPSEE